MQSLVVRGTQTEPELSVTDLPKPAPASAEVLIRIAAAGLIPTELGWPSTWTQRSGAVRINTVPSHEFSGMVETLGPDVSGMSVGDEVFGMNDWYMDGGMAEYCVARAQDVAPKPRTLSHAESASVPISALTAWQALFDHARIQADERVLIHGAAGSVGNFAVQLANGHGASVIATASAAHRDFVWKLGAAQVIDYKAQPFEKEVGPVDVVIDTVGGDTLKRSWSVLKPGGRLVTVASSSEALSDERSRKAFFIVQPDRDQLVRITSFLDSNKLKTFVRREVPLPDAASEYIAPVKGTGHGKTVVLI